jgi:hypothetical protein
LLPSQISDYNRDDHNEGLKDFQLPLHWGMRNSVSCIQHLYAVEEAGTPHNHHEAHDRSMGVPAELHSNHEGGTHSGREQDRGRHYTYLLCDSIPYEGIPVPGNEPLVLATCDFRCWRFTIPNSSIPACSYVINIQGILTLGI